MKKDFEEAYNKAEEYLDELVWRSFEKLLEEKPEIGGPGLSTVMIGVGFQKGFIEGYIKGIVISILENIESWFPGISLKEAYSMFHKILDGIKE